MQNCPMSIVWPPRNRLCSRWCPHPQTAGSVLDRSCGVHSARSSRGPGPWSLQHQPPACWVISVNRSRCQCVEDEEAHWYMLDVRKHKLYTICPKQNLEATELNVMSFQHKIIFPQHTQWLTAKECQGKEWSWVSVSWETDISPRLGMPVSKYLYIYKGNKHYMSLLVGIYRDRYILYTSLSKYFSLSKTKTDISLPPKHQRRTHLPKYRSII